MPSLSLSRSPFRVCDLVSCLFALSCCHVKISHGLSCHGGGGGDVMRRAAMP
jgi:hypothetical protein